MFGPEALRDDSRGIELAEFGFREADRESLHRTIDHLSHRRDNGAGIDAPTQECAERHIAREMEADALLQEFGEPFDEIRFAAFVVRLKANIPVALDADAAL